MSSLNALSVVVPLWPYYPDPHDSDSPSWHLLFCPHHPALPPGGLPPLPVPSPRSPAAPKRLREGGFLTGRGSLRFRGAMREFFRRIVSMNLVADEVTRRNV